MKESLISEPIEPVLDESSDLPFLTGEPVLPSRFRWRGRELRVDAVLETWKEYSEGTRQMPDRYLRKHWFRIRSADGVEMKIYFERQARSKGAAKQRWWIFTVAEGGEEA